LRGRWDRWRSDERSDAAAILHGRWWCAQTHYHRGEFVTARDLFEQCHGQQEPAHRQACSGAHGRLGHPFEGLSRLTDAGEIIEATDERHHEAEVYRLRGDLTNATGDQEAAERSYRRAIAAAERQNAKALEVRAATSLVRLWRDQGKRTEAHDLLAPIYGWFTEGFGTPVLKDVKAVLDQLA
jgi:tetratricopeptide (TPR) repeat protein